MLHQEILLLSVGILAIATVSPLSAAGNITANESLCPLTDIDSRLSVAMEIIETTKRKLPNDLKEICRKTSCEEKPLNCTECRKCPYEEKPTDCTKCPCEQKPINCSECGNNTRFSNPMDCSDIYQAGHHKDGTYEIWPQSRILNGSLRVYCDMRDGGGWTVIQRRGDFGNSENYFYHDWYAYKLGFGDMLKEFWIGNDILFALTNQRFYQIRIDLRDWEENFAYATYDEFWTDDEYHNYTLHVKGYSGTAGDSLSFHDGYQFSTKDRKNDIDSGYNCAELFKGAWWYKNCAQSSLNGPYLKGKQLTRGGVIWRHFKGDDYSLKDTIMKIRPIGFPSHSNISAH